MPKRAKHYWLVKSEPDAYNTVFDVPEEELDRIFEEIE